jgi:hypothetical protein
LPVSFTRVVKIRIRRDVGPDLVKFSGLPVALQEALDSSNKVIKHANVDVMEDMLPVEVIRFNMRKIPNNTLNGPCSGGIKPIFDSLHSLAIISFSGVLVLGNFCWNTTDLRRCDSRSSGSSVSNGSRIPGRGPGWNQNRGPGSVLEPP